ncbi:hypothetical protein JHK82_016667 [Glycine max]|nr:hypothetical protein JHK86_016701 [Glycine max]KAG5149786.1 hypothetical protein JHK82_016667 [Glycine max]
MDKIASSLSLELLKEPDSDALSVSQRLNMSFSHIIPAPNLILQTLNLSLQAGRAVQNQHVSHPTTFLGVPKNNQRKRKTPYILVVVVVTQGSAESSKSDEKIPSWAKSDSDEPPPWAQDKPNNNSS